MGGRGGGEGRWYTGSRDGGGRDVTIIGEREEERERRMKVLIREMRGGEGKGNEGRGGNVERRVFWEEKLMRGDRRRELDKGIQFLLVS